MTEDELSAENTAVALVGKGTPFTILEGHDLKAHLAALKAEDDAQPPGEPLLRMSPIINFHECQELEKHSGGT